MRSNSHGRTGLGRYLVFGDYRCLERRDRPERDRLDLRIEASLLAGFILNLAIGVRCIHELTPTFRAATLAPRMPLVNKYCAPSGSSMQKSFSRLLSKEADHLTRKSGN